MSDLVYPLLMAHLLSDFALQTDWMIRIKHKGALGVMPHIAVVALVTILSVLPQLGRWWLPVGIIVVTHTVIDIGKIKIDGQVKQRWLSILLFFLDQLLHWGIIFAVAAFALRAELPPVWQQVNLWTWNLLLLLVLAAFVSGILFRVFVPTYGWPNRWPTAFARGGTVLLIVWGMPWLAPIPILLALAYHYLKEKGLTRAIWAESLIGTGGAVVGALLFLALH